mgnify:CR=1 FL=1|jgi:hypothetical protein
MITIAQGKELDMYAVLLGTSRRDLETDEELRARLLSIVNQHYINLAITFYNFIEGRKGGH